jgi:hypothetical protein
MPIAAAAASQRPPATRREVAIGYLLSRVRRDFRASVIRCKT